MRRRARLGFAAGAFMLAVPVAARSQVVVPPGSEVPIPPKPETDSAQPKRDTIQPPFGRSVAPRTADIGPQYEWNREELFASGAYTLADLLERVPGATSFRTGWLASPKFVAVNGDPGRIRIFYDGLEIDNLDTRNGSLLELSTIDLWMLENVRIERFANELVLHLRSWTVERTDPYTRTDIYTGDENTNIYRGFFGRRFGNGAGVQLGAEQWSSRARRLGGGGDALSFMGRAGVARRLWSVDAFYSSRNAARSVQTTFGSGLSLPAFEGTHSLAYIRLAAGDRTGGPWGELLASKARFAETSPRTAGGPMAIADTADSTTKRFQYLATAGMVRGPFRATVASRIRSVDGETRHSPHARLEFATTIGSVMLFGEQDGFARTKRGDVVARFTPLPFIAVAGAYSITSPDFDDSQPTDEDEEPPLAFPGTSSSRLEVGLRAWRPWVIAGLISRDTALLVPPTVYDTAYVPQYIGRRTGLYAGIRGNVYKALNLDVVGTRWDSAGLYQPRYQARSELYLATRWLSRFPSGNFGLKVAFIHEYRGSVAFPTATGNLRTNASGVMNGLLEIRILRGVASYQVRNIAGENYQIVPDFFMPRAIGIYGIRWEFWN